MSITFENPIPYRLLYVTSPINDPNYIALINHLGQDRVKQMILERNVKLANITPGNKFYVSLSDLNGMPLRSWNQFDPTSFDQLLTTIPVVQKGGALSMEKNYHELKNEYLNFKNNVITKFSY